jgi:hypothetical protein
MSIDSDSLPPAPIDDPLRRQPSSFPVDQPLRQLRHRGFAFYLSAALCAVFMVRVLGSDWNSHFRATWPDALFPKEGYMAVAGLGPFRPSFYFAFRPIGYPAYLWAFGRSSHPAVIGQAVLYCASVVGLCTTAWRVFRSRVVAVLTIALLLGVAVQPKYSMWTTQILSESLSISIGFAAIAAWWRFAAEPTRKRAIWGWVFVIAWCLVRNSNVVAAVAVIVPTTLLIAWRARRLETKIRRALVIGAAVLVFTGAYSYVSQETGGPSKLVLQDLIGVRVLPDPTLSSWFAAHGMPLDDALRTRTGKAGFDDTFWRSTDPKFARYFKWSDASGSTTYARSLLALPTHYRNLFYKDLPTMLRADMSYYDSHHVYGRLPHQMPLQLGGPSTRKGLTIWLMFSVVALAATAAATVRLRRRRYLGLALFGALSLTVALAELFLAWFGEPIEIQRHAIGAVCMLAVLLIIVVATGVDAVVELITVGRQKPDGTIDGAAPENTAPDDSEAVPLGV